MYVRVCVDAYTGTHVCQATHHEGTPPAKVRHATTEHGTRWVDDDIKINEQSLGRLHSEQLDWQHLSPQPLSHVAVHVAVQVMM